MRAARLAIGAAGILLVLIGLVNLRELDGGQLVSTFLWLAGGVLVHDALLAPLTILVVVVARRLVPPPARSAATVGLLVWGTVTIATANVLLGMGGVPDNDTLLNRPYVGWWLALTVVWWLGVAVLGLLAVRRARPVLRPSAGS
ncbi:hypothetical protein ACHAAC_17345 [Aeromicrobium sp. CF4.19]|uniref:hypothetical protein n=1 Tax=Aeromicrobium sp. CF4.19 TaxID=3373082 RepID=UPI003EE4BE48